MIRQGDDVGPQAITRPDCIGRRQATGFGQYSTNTDPFLAIFNDPVQSQMSAASQQSSTTTSRSSARARNRMDRAGSGFTDRPISGMTAIFFHNSRSISDETTETQPLAGLQGEGGFGRPNQVWSSDLTQPTPASRWPSRPEESQCRIARQARRNRGEHGATMNRTLEEVKTDLEQLSPLDFEYSHIDARGLERLNQFCTEITEFRTELAAPILFATMERLDGCDLGSPGPLVHTLESMPNYQRFLKDSLFRKPTLLSVWMINRILNSHPMNSADWLSLLRRTSSHPAASAETKQQAIHFLKCQAQT